YGSNKNILFFQFDDFVRSIQVDPHSPLFRLVTDGQPPLRQCLHPEACSKELTLPAYYARFHDLRKEYVRTYTLRAVAPPRAQAPPPPPPPDHPTSLLDMLNYLGITPYAGENFYAAEVKDMTSIIQRIISDGFRLELPETVDLVLETGIW
ncbi:RNA-binding protein fusilli-like, partial [Manduca sexta]|uniref:RNA-binding protein fusilli-like n=1 Tax=Manduca sexta TaxID=7130 RepID=UPI00188F5AE1